MDGQLEMNLFAAQIRAIAGDIDTNIARHIDAVNLAASKGADLLLFPELSVTGYEPALAETLAMPPSDSRLDVFQALSDQYRMLIAVGAPTRGSKGVEISLISFLPGLERKTYSKQHLHTDELPFFSAGTHPLLLEHGRHVLAPAICYESLLPKHAEQAAESAAQVYMASVAKSEKGVAAAYRHYSEVAEKHSMTVIMANCVGAADNFVGAGLSAIWKSDGEMACSTSSTQDALVAYDTQTGEASVYTLA